MMGGKSYMDCVFMYLFYYLYVFFFLENLFSWTLKYPVRARSKIIKSRERRHQLKEYNREGTVNALP